MAYVTVPGNDMWRWIGTEGDNPVSKIDTDYVTHINYAAATFKVYQFEDGISGCPLMDGRISSPEAYRNLSDGQYHYRAVVDGAWIEGMDKPTDNSGKYLKALVDLKKQKPELKVLLMVGGWDSDGWCYMARTKEGREEFIQSLIDLINEYKLDGVDIDWEFPGNGGYGEIAWCTHCEEDALSFILEAREAFDSAFPNEHKLLTAATQARDGMGMVVWQIAPELLGSLDYINVMCYDYRSFQNGINQAPMEWCGESMNLIAKWVGDTPENRSKINLGIPFYNGSGASATPYYQEWDGVVTASPEITREKMQWVKDNGYGGGFYWHYSMDFFDGDAVNGNKNPKDLQRALYETLYGE